MTNPVEGWDHVARLDPRFVIFGEEHGTNEAPHFVGRVAASLAGQGKRVLVAVELGVIDNAHFQAVWHGPHDDFAERLSERGWQGESGGVTSRAMLEMLTDLHAKKQYGAHLSIVAFNGFRDDAQRRRLDTGSSQSGHEAAQAENIIAAANQGDFDHIIILVGELHAIKANVEIGGDTFEPMAMHLERAGRTVSLAMRSSGGTAWNCILAQHGIEAPQGPITRAMLDCGNHPVRATAASNQSPHIALTPRPVGRRQEFDGYFMVGPVTGSPPAKP